MHADFSVPVESQRLAALREEWARVEQAIEEQDRRSLREKVAEWEPLVARLRDEHRRLVAEGRWLRGPADLMAVLDQERRETYHSKAIAWLLDPLAPHGLGAGFLDAFLAACDDSWGAVEDPSGVTVQCEEARGECRADIVVRADGFTLVVENKIDAGEGIRQCERIYEAFRHEHEPRFVFLTLNGQPPLTASDEAAEHFRTVRYRDLADALETLLHDEKLERPSADGPSPSNTLGRSTALNYAHTLRRIS